MKSQNKKGIHYSPLLYSFIFLLGFSFILLAGFAYITSGYDKNFFQLIIFLLLSGSILTILALFYSFKLFKLKIATVFINLFLGLFLSFIFTLVSFPFLNYNIDKLPIDEQSTAGIINMWRVAIIFGILSVFTGILTFSRKRFIITSVIIFMFFVLGTYSAAFFTLNSLNAEEENISACGGKNCDFSNVVKDRNSCNEEQTLEAAKLCTTVIIRDDEGHGTGFSVEPGYLLTNKHVIEGAKKLEAWINGEWQEVSVWNYSPTFDTAVLKLPEEIPTCKWFDSDQLNLAETLYTVGWPDASDGDSTITKGIYSRLNKYNDGLEFVQTDAPINPGNSGGPLLNACGIVGINTEKSFWTDEELPRPLEGLGNALSSHMLIPLFDNLIANGKETSIPKSEKTYQSTGPDIPNTQSNLDVAEISEYLNSLREARESWINAYGEYPKDKLDFLIDSFDRQISFCESLISRLNSKKYASQDDYLMWDAIIKMSYESAAIANELNSY